MWYTYPPEVSHKIITPHRAGVLVGNLHRLLVEEVFGKQQGEGWQRGLSSFVMNALSFALLKRIYIAADEAGTFNEAHQRAHRDLPYLVIGFDAATESVGILYDYVERWCVLAECLNDGEIVDAFIEELGGQFFLTQFACTLKNDAVSAFYIRRDVEAVIIFIELRRRIAESASTEIVSRFRDFPEIVQKMIGMYGDTDSLRQSQHWEKVWDYKEISARRHRLSDEGKDKVWDLIKDRLEPLSDTDLRSQLVWMEENHKPLKFFPRHIKKRAGGIWTKEQQRAKRFLSLDAMPTLEFQAVEAQTAYYPSTDTDDNFMPDQLDALLKLFSGKKQKKSTGERRLKVFLYRYHHREACQHGGQKIISEKLGIPETTVSNDLQFIEVHATQIKKSMGR